MSGSLPGRSFALVFGSRSVFDFGTLKYFFAVLEIYGVFSRNVSVSRIISRVAGYADRGNFFATLFRRIPTVKSINFINCVTVGGGGNGYGRAMRKFIGSNYRFSELEYDCILSYACREMRIVRSVAGYREIGNRVAAFFRSIPAVERIRINFRGSLRRICGSGCRRAVFYGLSFSYLLAVADKLYFVFILNRIQNEFIGRVRGGRHEFFIPFPGISKLRGIGGKRGKFVRVFGNNAFLYGNGF